MLLILIMFYWWLNTGSSPCKAKKIIQIINYKESNFYIFKNSVTKLELDYLLYHSIPVDFIGTFIGGFKVFTGICIISIIMLVAVVEGF